MTFSSLYELVRSNGVVFFTPKPPIFQVSKSGCSCLNLQLRCAQSLLEESELVACTMEELHWTIKFSTASLDVVSKIDDFS